MPDPRSVAYHLLRRATNALMHAMGQNSSPALRAAEATLVRAIVGATHYSDELLLMDVLASMSDRQIAAWIPRFEGMCAYACALADYQEARRASRVRCTLRRHLWGGLTRFNP